MMRLFVMLVLMGVGVVLAVAGGKNVLRAHASQTWPSVRGTVIYSYVEKTLRDDDPEYYAHRTADQYTYRPVVKYAYSVQGTPYTSDTFAFDRTGTGGPFDAQAVSRQYRRGQPVTVHYEPDDPAVACLQCGSTEPVNHVAMLGGGVFVLLAIGNLVEIWRRARAPIPQPPPDAVR
ncbi:DUF3592 domain-containing protein [Corallococcus macrosporus]|uniref:DUF3592 domain-containing protein n=1 Tax=Corallococcus macrosporus TaxID=35 RepID=A0ABS3DN19_9BACT|nr:DUF3592 domain-containing protein [Corallococcus macrosporus]MBN8232740.1 DUF3592 domain-containing protein [Corallococcus macrosporus]